MAIEYIDWIKSKLVDYDPQVQKPVDTTTYLRDVAQIALPDFSLDAAGFLKMDGGGMGSDSALGQPWLAQNSVTQPDIALDAKSELTPIREAGRTLRWGLSEIDKWQRMGLDLATEKINFLQLDFSNRTDVWAYVGDRKLGANGFSASGLANNPRVSIDTLVASWASATWDKILADINDFLTQITLDSDLSTAPTRMLMPPAVIARLNSIIVPDSGGQTLLEFIKNKSISTATNNSPLEIFAVRHLATASDSGTPRIVAYTPSEQYARMRVKPPTRMSEVVHAHNVLVAYQWALGEVELPYPKTVGYLEGF